MRSIFFKILICPILVVATPIFAGKSPLEASRESMTRRESKRLAKMVKEDEYYSRITTAFRDGDFSKTVLNSYALLRYYPNSILCDEVLYLRAMSFYRLGDFDLANEAFSKYLSSHFTIKHFEEAIQYKYQIAEKFAKGKRKHLFGQARLPKWLRAREDALQIYDEIIATMPRSEIAAKSLFAKAKLLVYLESYKEGIEAYQELIKQFPKHVLATDSFVEIAEAFLRQCRREFPDPNFIELAEINLRKFRGEFPGDERVDQLQARLELMKEHFAQDLYKNGQYFEKKKKDKAAFLYYLSVIQKYPTTKVAERAINRIAYLKSHSKESNELSLLTPTNS